MRILRASGLAALLFLAPAALASGWVCEASECSAVLIHSNGLRTEITVKRGEALFPAQDVTYILRIDQWKPKE